MIKQLSCLFLGALLLASYARAEGRQTLSDMQLTVAFGSCVEHKDKKIWKRVLEHDPAALILLGDTIYLDESDIGNRSRILARMRDLYSNRSFKILRNRIPVYAIWDDHDSGLNNGDSQAAGIDSNRNAFAEFWNIERASVLFEDSIVRSVELQEVELLLTDNRSFRVNEPPDRVHYWGSAQFDWILKRIALKTNHPLVLASGNQLLPEDCRSECLSRFPAEYMRFKQALFEADRPIVLLSGDAHYGAVHLHPDIPGVVECTASPLSGTVRHRKEEHIRPALIFDQSPHVGFLEVKALPGGYQFQCVFVSRSGKEKKHFQWSTME